MDIQDNLFIEIGDKNPYIIPINLNHLSSRTILFEFNENSYVNLKISSTKYEVKVEVNESLSDYNEKYLKVLRNEDEVLISTNNKSYYPSIYLLIIKNLETGKVTYKHFKVKPLPVFNDDPLMYSDLRSVITSYSKSLIYDYSKRKYVSLLDKGIMINSLIALSEYLFKYKDIISSALLGAKLNPIFDLKKEMVKSLKGGKENYKTILKNLTNFDDKNYIIKTTLNYNTLENETLKFYLNQSYIKLIDYLDKYDSMLYSLNEEKTNYINVLNTYKNKDCDAYIRIDNEYKEVITKLSLFNETTKIINKFISLINDLRYNSNLSEIRIHKVSLNDKFMKNNNYRNIYNYLYKMEDKENLDVASDTRVLGYGYKETSTLYEIYSLIVILRVIEESGFIIDPNESSSTLKDLEVLNGDIVFNFTNGKVKCKLMYDKKVNDINNYNKKELINVNSHHDKPDFQILLFDEEDKLLRSIIIDAKCRRRRDLELDETGDKKIKEIMLDYMQFRYKDTTDPLIRAKVATSDLIMFTPDITLTQAECNVLYGIIYFPISPSSSILKDSSYIEFKNYFQSILKIIG